MRTEDCKWGHCYACGVPGNGEDTVLAVADAGDAAHGGARGARRAPREDPAVVSRRGQGRRVPPEGDARSPVGGAGSARLHRHAAALPHHVREVGRRALPLAPEHDGRLRARDPGGGPAGALLRGLQPAHEALDGPGPPPRPREPATRSSTSRASPDFPATPRSGSPRSSRTGSRVLEVRELGPADRALSKAVKGARYAVRLESDGARRPGGRRRSRTDGATRSPRCGPSRSRRTRTGRACASRSTSTRRPARRPRRRRSSSACSRSRPDDAGRALGHPRSDPSRLRKTRRIRAVPRHRVRPLRGGAQPDRLRGRPGAAPRPLLPRRGGPRVGEAPAIRPRRRLRRGAQAALDAIAKELDYTYLNEHPAFAGRNTSAENLARHFAERLESSGALGWARVAEVTVWEGPENRATYVPAGRA